MASAKKKPSSLADNPPVELYGPEDGGWYTTRVYDWIPLCPCLRDPDVRGYLILRSLVIEKYKNPVRKLTLLDLCELIPSPTEGQPSSLTRVRGILDALSKVQLICTPEGGPVKTSSRASASGKPIRIRVNDMPPEGYAGWRNTEDKLSHLARVRAEQEAGRKSDPVPDGDADEEGVGRKSDPAGRKSDPRGRKSDPDSVDDLPEPEVPLVSSVGTRSGVDVPSARSAGGVRSTATFRSSELEDGSGFAAAGKEGSSSDEEDGTTGVPGQRQTDGPELSREQLVAVRRVEALLPPALVAVLPYQQFPKRNRPAVLEALESRTVEQLRERVGRRWVAYGYEPALYDGTLIQPVGAALELIAPNRYCPDLSCEDGTMIDTGAECRTCLERRVSRRAARAAGQLKKSSSKRSGSGRAPECIICQAPFHGDVPASGECAGCEKEAAAAFAALSARLGPPDVDWQDLDEQAAEEPQGPQDEPEVDAETLRLRAEIARQFGTPDQVEAYCGTEATGAYGPPPF